MSRPAKVLLLGALFAAAAVLATACGTQKISVPSSDAALHEGAVLFNQRCSGCHTLSYAATHGSAQNVRTAQFNNGPNFDIRCERPVARVLYAIQNGGFSGVVMPQNVVVGQQAVDVAEFVAKYSGTKAPKIPGVVQCSQTPVGSVAEALAPSSAPTSTGPTPQTVTGTSKSSKPSSTSTAATGGKPLKIASKAIPGLGNVLVNSAGHTLYVFAPDNHSKVTCTGGCASIWPPASVPAGGHPVGTGGVKASLLGTAPNPSGGTVVTYAGWPLYTYVADTAAGSAAGQDVNLNGGFWWVITTSGTVVKKKP